ncbi:MAG: class C sortase [Oscillospiraceae bacterium]|nr:class C sortase [Oscillospiraceae bacterium]
MKRALTNFILILVFLIGLSLLLYPSVSDWWNSMHQTRAIANYSETVARLDTGVYDDIWQRAEAYNASLARQGIRWTLSDGELAEYNSQLDPGGTGIMGYIEIPKINCSLPIYHGTGDSVLQIAIGHIEGTSLPVGGESTHCVLSGHRGLPSAKLFTNLDQLEAGDVFMLEVLNEVLSYEVDQILIVLPHEVDALAIQEGEDLCTLVTCTPYGVNSHRLLVRGHRVENQASAGRIRVTAEAILIEPLIVAPIVAVPMLLLLLVWLFVSTGKKSRRR